MNLKITKKKNEKITASRVNVSTEMAFSRCLKKKKNLNYLFNCSSLDDCVCLIDTDLAFKRRCQKVFLICVVVGRWRFHYPLEMPFNFINFLFYFYKLSCCVFLCFSLFITQYGASTRKASIPTVNFFSLIVCNMENSLLSLPSFYNTLIILLLFLFLLLAPNFNRRVPLRASSEPSFLLDHFFSFTLPSRPRRYFH